MDKVATENLFLLEFLVDSVELDRKCDCDTPPGETCVSFQFLDNAPLDVCEADFCPKRQYGKETGNIKSGKSCLFSLTPDQAKNAIQQFDVYVKVFKKMQPGWLPEIVDVGNCVVSISTLFTDLVESIEASENSTPTAKTLKETYEIATETGSVVGKISVYIRMSCFGKLIVTQFQMNLDDKSVLFKDKEGKSLYRYKKAKKSEVDGPPNQQQTGRGSNVGYNQSIPQVPGPPPGAMPDFGGGMMPGGNFPPFMQNGFPGGAPGMGATNTNCPNVSCAQFLQGAFGGGAEGMFGGGGMFPPGADPFSGGGGGMMGMTPDWAGAAGGMDMFGGRGGTAASSQPPTPCPECGQIPNPAMMPGQFGGGPMNFPIPQDNGAPCNECAFLPFAPCAPANGAGNAAQDQNGPEGNYQEIGAKMGPNSLTIRVHKDMNKVEQVDETSSNISDVQGCGCTVGNMGGGKKKRNSDAAENGGATGKQETQNLQMRPGVQQGNENLPFSFKMGGCGQAAKNNVIVNPPVATTQDGTQFTELSDPDKEVFVLRIGKKSEGIDKKNNLELELCTPKGPDLKPKPKKETRDTQYDPNDAGGDSTGGKKGKKDKGGKGKGGKGGKGKKK